MLFRTIIRRITGQPAPATLDLRVDGELVPLVLLRRAGMKRLTLRMRLADGAIVLSAPRRASMAAIRDFAERHTAWVAERLRTRRIHGALEPGRRICLRGEPCMLTHVAALRGLPKLVPAGPDGVGELCISGAIEHFERRVMDYLKKQARADLQVAVARHAANLGVTYTSLAVRDQASRWGSCTARKGLSFSWRLIMAPPDILDYLAAHEVAHLKEMNHGPRFWAHVAQLCPDHERAQDWLRQHGPALQMVGRGTGQAGDAAANVQL